MARKARGTSATNGARTRVNAADYQFAVWSNGKRNPLGFAKDADEAKSLIETMSKPAKAVVYRRVDAAPEITTSVKIDLD